MRRLLTAFAVCCAALGATASPSVAIVGGHDAAAGTHPAVAGITFGQSFLCTGTLIAPAWVPTAGYSGSVTGAAVASPASTRVADTTPREWIGSQAPDVVD
jgi:hypothetical protein